MYHLVARVRAPHLMCRSWEEFAWLWERIGRIPNLAACALMPNHLHLVHPSDIRVELARLLSGFVRWRRARDPHQPVEFEPLPPAERLADLKKVRTTVRYVHLNPCRARLVTDPLEWPFSTHRDAVGLAVRPIVPVRRDPARFHAYVSGDPSVAVEGTELPTWGKRGPYTLMEVRVAVSAAARVPYDAIGESPATRDLFIRAAKRLSDANGRKIAEEIGVTLSSVRHRAGPDGRSVDIVQRIVADPRFGPLDAGYLVGSWNRYRDDDDS